MIEDELMDALRSSIADEYDVLGLLGRSDEVSVVFLAREMRDGGLVAVKLEQVGTDEDGEPQYTYDVIRELDASVPDPEPTCPRCKATLRRWARFCAQCGVDVSGVSTSMEGSMSRSALLEAVRATANENFEILGDMPRRQGGGLVYFARDVSTGRIVTLRLNKKGSSGYSLGVTRVLKALPKPEKAKDSHTTGISVRRKPEPSARPRGSSDAESRSGAERWDAGRERPGVGRGGGDDPSVRRGGEGRRAQGERWERERLDEPPRRRTSAERARAEHDVAEAPRRGSKGPGDGGAGSSIAMDSRLKLAIGVIVVLTVALILAIAG